jgi:hypothetical protein
MATSKAKPAKKTTSKRAKAPAKSASAKKPAPKKPTMKTKATLVSPEDFIARVENETRRKDAETLLDLFSRATGWKAQMWGPTIVGFGRYDYVYDSGNSGAICVVGFSPRKANLVIYAHPDLSGKSAELLARLGKHKGGLDSCLYINKLSDVDPDVLEEIVKLGVVTLKKTAAEKDWPVSAA